MNRQSVGGHNLGVSTRTEGTPTNFGISQTVDVRFYPGQKEHNSDFGG